MNSNNTNLSENKQLRILVSAYACEPNKGSEPGVGWNWVKQIARYCEVWVIALASNRAVIEEQLSKEPLPMVHFCYYDLPYCLRFWNKGSRGIRLHYYLWQIGIYWLARRLYSKIKFDIGHHITFVSYRFPSFVALLPIPFIWGPLAGGQNSPYFMRVEYDLKGRIKEGIRDISQILSLWDPFVRLTMKRARMILVVNRDTEKIIPWKYRSKLRVIPAIGISKNDFHEIDRNRKVVKEEDSMKILSAGEMVPLKAFSLAIKTLAHLNANCNSRLTLVGDGPEFKRLKKMASHLKISNKVEFTGELSRESTLREISNADVFLFPSLRDSGGFVVLEAMAAAKPVVCLDIGGPGEIVTKGCGIKIKPVTAKQVLQELVNAVEQLAKDAELRRRMGEAGRERVQEYYMWNKKGEEIIEIYDSLLLKR